LSEDSFLRLRPWLDDWWAWLACPNESAGGAGKCGGGNLLLRPRPLRLLLVKSRAPSEYEDELLVEVVDSLALVKSAYGLV
jgi:hypothetical protein